jgi:acetyl esterase/lipase
VKSVLALCLMGLLLMTDTTEAAEYQVTTQSNIEYVQHDGITLAGDLYLPKGLDKAPVLVAVHGGGWQGSSRENYRYWGPYLVKNGYAVFAVSYRLSKPNAKTFPAAVYDVKAAIQFVRAKAGELGVDPERIGAIGDSAGAHLAALVALAGEEPLFSSEYRNDPHATVSPGVKAVVGIYGVYDLQAQWEHDQLKRPRDQITEKFIGAPPMTNRRAYFDASPTSYATTDKNRIRFLIVYGTADDIVDHVTQSERFLLSLKQAQFFARTVVIPGGPHFWITDPIDEPGSIGQRVGPSILRFLASSL